MPSTISEQSQRDEGLKLEISSWPIADCPICSTDQEKRFCVQLEGNWQLSALCAHPSEHSAKALEQIFT